MSDLLQVDNLVARHGLLQAVREVSLSVAVGEDVAAGQKLLTLEAMKMETTLYAERPGKVAEVLVRAGTLVEGGVQNGDHLIVYPEVVAGSNG